MDSHVHLDLFPPESRESVIHAAFSVGIQVLIAVATALSADSLLREIIAAHPGKIFRTVGVHPSQIADGEPFSEKLQILIDGNRPVAVGETGLDYGSLSSREDRARRTVEAQRAAFEGQAAAALRADLPLVIHCRDRMGETEAFTAILGILAALRFPPWRALLHCFSYGPEEVKRWQGEGGFVSFSGLLTGSRGDSIRRALAVADRGQILFETDGPFLLPEPLRTETPGALNGPENVVLVSNFAAGILGISGPEAANLGLRNGRQFFSLEA
jgi:TatD DNase family protein